MRAKYTVKGRGADGTPQTLYKGTTAGDMIFDSTANAITAIVREFQHSTEDNLWTSITIEISRYSIEDPSL